MGRTRYKREQEIMKIVVYGLWHLGTVTSACLAEIGHSVTGFDESVKVINSLSNGVLPVSEPGLDELVLKNFREGKLQYVSDSSQLPDEFDYLWVTIDTPVDDSDDADSTGVINSIIEIVKNVPVGCRIIISSQLPAGTTKRIRDLTEPMVTERKLAFCYSPENLRLGGALNIFLNPDRIVVGVDSQEDFEKFEPLFLTISNRIERMSSVSAEMTKHALNTFLALSVAFANEIATIAENEGASAVDVTRGLRTDIRIGPKAYLLPGDSFAGGTLARDVRYLEQKSIDHNISTPIIDSIIPSNDAHSLWAKNTIYRTINNLSGKEFTLCGLAYKPNTNTLRRSRTVELGDWLLEQGALVSVVDHGTFEIPKNWHGRIKVIENIQEAIYKADVLIVGPSYKIPEIAMNDLDRGSDLLVLDAGRRWPKLAELKRVNYQFVGKERD